MTTAPDWYPDPEQPGLQRWWDGIAWTAATLPAAPTPSPFRPDPGAMPLDPDGSLLDAPLLRIRQAHASYRYEIRDAAGVVVGSVAETGRSPGGEMLRRVLGRGQFAAHRLAVTGPAGLPILTLERPATRGRSSGIIGSGDGREIGRLEQPGRFSTPGVEVVVAGTRVGTVEQTGQGFFGFAVLDNNRVELARMERLPDNEYLLKRTRPVPEPWRSLIVAVPLMIDVIYAHIGPTNYQAP